MLDGTYVSGGKLYVDGSDSSDNTVALSQQSGQITATLNGQSKSYSSSGISNVVVRTGNGDDIIAADASVWIDISIFAGDGNDFIATGSGNDIIHAYGGNDTIVANAGNDTIHAGDGNDQLFGGPGDDALSGEDGNDTLVGGSGRDVGLGDSGSDTGYEAEWYSSVEIQKSGTLSTPSTPGSTGGTDGVPTEPSTPPTATTGLPSGVAWVSAGRLYINGSNNSANDIRVGYISSANVLYVTYNGATGGFSRSGLNGVRIEGGAKNDTLVVDDNVDMRVTIVGHSGDDYIQGGPWSDLLYGYLGNDTIVGGNGNDSIYGNEGNDFLDGGNGSDLLDGGSGSDTGINGESRSSIESTSGSTPTSPTTPTTPTTPSGIPSSAVYISGDRLYIKGSSSSSNTIKVTYNSGSKVLTVSYNGQSQDYSRGSVTGIIVNGGSSADNITIDPSVSIRATITGGSGNDYIVGGPWNDSISGEAGNDTIFGNGGQDYLSGGDGDDSLDGGSGTDTLDGGSGNDRGNAGESYISIENGEVTPTNPNPPTTTPPATGASNPPVTNSNASSPVARYTALATTIMAGTSLHVEGLGSSLNVGNPSTARYEWNFGDSNSKYNTLVGYNAGHVYDNPGTYTVKLRVVNEAGKTDTVSFNVTVKADTRQTYYVASNGSDSNNGSYSSPFRTFAKAASVIESRSDAKVLFRRGDTFDVQDVMLIKGSNVTIGAFGSGSKPTIRYTGPLAKARYIFVPDVGSEGTTIENLTITSIYTDKNIERTTMPYSVQSYGTRTVIRGNTFLDVGYAVNGNAQPTGVLIQDNDAPKESGIRSYFAWIDGSQWVLLGNTVANSTREHAVRISGANRVLLHANDLQNLDRRSVDGSDFAKGALTMQKSDYVYVHENILRGPASVGPLGEADGIGEKWARTRYAVWDGNEFIGATFDVRHGAERTVLKNNVFRVNGTVAVNVDQYNYDYGRGVVDLSLLNNTAINNDSSGNFFRVQGDVQGIRMVNNLYVAPKLQAGSFGTAPVQVFDNNLNSFTEIDNNIWSMPFTSKWSGDGVNIIAYANTAANDGYASAGEWNAFPQVGTDYFVDTNVDGNYKPYSGQTASSGGKVINGVVSDFYNNYRPGSGWSVGAVQ